MELADILSAPHTWDQLGFLGKNWDGPLLLKGIQHVGDAKPAVEAGCDGMVVSDHGDSMSQYHMGSLR